MNVIRTVDANFLAEFEEILAWTVELGVNPHSRFHSYFRSIQLLQAEEAKADLDETYHSLGRDGRLNGILSTMTESIELVETIPELRRRDIVIPLEVLKRAFSGPADTSMEDKTSNDARNAMFEISMSAMAARSGFMPKLSTGNPDLSFEFEGRRVNIECKRVMSEAKVIARLKEGAEQLGKSCSRGNLDVGLVAISLAKLINPGDRYLISEEPHEELSRRLQTLLQANEQVLATIARGGLTGFIFYLSIPAQVPGKGYALVNCGTMFPVDLAEQVFLQGLSNSLFA